MRQAWTATISTGPVHCLKKISCIVISKKAWHIRSPVSAIYQHRHIGCYLQINKTNTDHKLAKKSSSQTFVLHAWDIKNYSWPLKSLILIKPCQRWNSRESGIDQLYYFTYQEDRRRGWQFFWVAIFGGVSVHNCSKPSFDLLSCLSFVWFSLYFCGYACMHVLPQAKTQFFSTFQNQGDCKKFL